MTLQKKGTNSNLIFFSKEKSWTFSLHFYINYKKKKKSPRFSLTVSYCYVKAIIKESFTLSNLFQDTVEECKRNDKEYLEWAYKKYDFLSDAIKYLGYDRIEEMEYNMARIKRALIPFSHKDVKDKIKILLSEYKEIFIGGFVSNERMREIFGEIYKQLDLSKVPKSTDILEYHQVKNHKKYINKSYKNGIVIMV
jgi:hypothetical protein